MQNVLLALSGFTHRITEFWNQMTSLRLCFGSTPSFCRWKHWGRRGQVISSRSHWAMPGAQDSCLPDSSPFVISIREGLTPNLASFCYRNQSFTHPPGGCWLSLNFAAFTGYHNKGRQFPLSWLTKLSIFFIFYLRLADFKRGIFSLGLMGISNVPDSSSFWTLIFLRSEVKKMTFFSFLFE